MHARVVLGMGKKCPVYVCTYAYVGVRSSAVMSAVQGIFTEGFQSILYVMMPLMCSLLHKPLMSRVILDFV